MKKSLQWYQKQSAQSVFLGTPSIPVVMSTGPNTRSGKDGTETPKIGDKQFIVGESVVGGPDRVGGAK